MDRKPLNVAWRTIKKVKRFTVSKTLQVSKTLATNKLQIAASLQPTSSTIHNFFRKCKKQNCFSLVRTWYLLTHCLLTAVLPQKKVSLNVFLDTFMSDPPPQCLVWLPLMHRLANVENGAL